MSLSCVFRAYNAPYNAFVGVLNVTRTFAETVLNCLSPSAALYRESAVEYLLIFSSFGLGVRLCLTGTPGIPLCTRDDACYLRYRVLVWVERKIRVTPQTLRLCVMLSFWRMMIFLFCVPNIENQQNLQKSLLGLFATLCRFYTPPLVVGGDKSRQRSSASFACLFFATASFSVRYFIVK